jgi:acyl transferase domain-containing protein
MIVIITIIIIIIILPSSSSSHPTCRSSMQVALTALLEAVGVVPQAVVGHSAGEVR